jgi:hypothetical protein
VNRTLNRHYFGRAYFRRRRWPLTRRGTAALCAALLGIALILWRM